MLTRCRGVTFSHAVVRICCSFLTDSVDEGERFPASVPVYWVMTRRGGTWPAASEFKADLYLRPPGGIVHWSVLLLRNLQSLGNESEHCSAPPCIEFFGDIPSFACLPMKSERSCPSLMVAHSLVVHRTFLPCFSITFHESYFLFCTFIIP